MTLVVQPFFPHPFFFLFFAAVMASAWLGGTLPGILAVCASTVAAEYFLVPPIYSLKVNATEETYFIAFIICALVTSFAGSLTKKSETTLKDACIQLQFHAAERTMELEKSRAEVARLEGEKIELSERLETRKLIERAKGILQRKLTISENEAYLVLQRQSRQRSKSMKEVAQVILLKDEIETGKP
jgi:K+-sensing histidine kinase KdpD